MGTTEHEEPRFFFILNKGAKSGGEITHAVLLLMPVSSLLSPLLSLMVFIIGTLYELRRISGCVSVREWMQSQVNEQTNEDLHLDFDDVNFDYVDFYRTNPATGLAMHGGFDSAGNTFGTCWQDYDDRR